MIQSLFDEYRFFSKYPEKELRITAILYGKRKYEMIFWHIFGAGGYGVLCVFGKKTFSFLQTRK